MAEYKIHAEQLNIEYWIKFENMIANVDVFSVSTQSEKNYNVLLQKFKIMETFAESCLSTSNIFELLFFQLFPW